VEEEFGQNWTNLADEMEKKDGEKLDPLVEKQIHGSNSTKLHHTNKSQKNGVIFVGIFEIGKKSTKLS